MKIGIVSNVRDLRYIAEGSEVKDTKSETDDSKDVEIDIEEDIGEVGKPEDPEISILID